MKEVWKFTHTKAYKVSSTGRVLSLKRTANCIRNSKRSVKETMLTPILSNQGYIHYNIGGKVYSGHRLVAKAFIPNPHGKRTVNHINGNKIDNRVSNLEWATYQENMVHAFKNGLHKPVIGKPVVQMDLDGIEIATFKSGCEAAIIVGVQQGKISLCCRGDRKRAGKYKWKFKDTRPDGPGL